jgi:predicted DNA-binding ribbon-helix-helix protein
MDVSDLVAGRPVKGEGVPDVADAAPSMLEQLSITEFRAVATRRGRKGLRLELVVWKALELMASWRGLKRHGLVPHIVEEAERLELNSASALRSFVVSGLLSEIDRLSALVEKSATISLLQQAPVPSFAVDRMKRVLRINGEFTQFVRVLFAENGDALTGRALQLNLDTPVPEIFAALGTSGEARIFTMNVVVDGRARRVRTRILAVPPQKPEVLVGYVLS